MGVLSRTSPLKDCHHSHHSRIRNQRQTKKDLPDQQGYWELKCTQENQSSNITGPSGTAKRGGKKLCFFSLLNQTINHLYSLGVQLLLGLCLCLSRRFSTYLLLFDSHFYYLGIGSGKGKRETKR